MVKPFTLLHISDLHRSSDDPISNEEILSALMADFDRYQNENPAISQPDAIIVSGDIIQGVNLNVPDYKTKLIEQYEVALAFLNELTNRFLNGDKSKVILIPGNHDVDWNTAFNAMEEIPPSDISSNFASDLASDNSIYRWDWKRRIAYKISNRPLYDKRLDYFWQFFEKFYEGVLGLHKVNSQSDGNLYLLHNGQIAVGAFNSCHGNDCFAFHGNIKKEVIARSDLDLRDENFAGLRIAVWHHNLDGPPYRTDYMDGDIVKGMIGRGFRLGLYGHQHKVQLTPFQIWLPDNETMALVSAGSLCAGKKELPTGYNRQYNILEIAEDLKSVRVHVREMVVANLFGKGRIKDLGGVSYVDLRWELPNNILGGKIDTKKNQQRNTILLAEKALNDGKFEEVISYLDSINIPPDTYQRKMFIEATENASKWEKLIEKITPTSILELESVLNAYQKLKAFDDALIGLDKYATVLSMQEKDREEFKKRIETNKIISQNVHQ